MNVSADGTSIVISGDCILDKLYEAVATGDSVRFMVTNPAGSASVTRMWATE